MDVEGEGSSQLGNGFDGTLWQLKIKSDNISPIGFS
jgi:hypothetical protein